MGFEEWIRIHPSRIGGRDVRGGFTMVAFDGLRDWRVIEPRDSRV